MSAPSIRSPEPAWQEQGRFAALSRDAEFELLLACGAQCSAAERQARVRAALQGPIDWQRLSCSADHHGLVPLVYETLCKDAAAAKEGIAVLRGPYESNTQRTLWLTRELGRVLAHLRSREIPALALKGPALAQSLYQNVAARQFTDLDVLIHGRDFARARAALVELGFKAGVELSPQEERSHLRSGYEFTFDTPNGRNLLELQWQILPRFYSVDFDVAGFFDRSREQPVAEMMVRVLGEEDQLLALCAHAWKHAWIQLSLLCDIAKLAQSPAIDWDSVRRQADALRIRRLVEVTFLLAHRLLGSPLYGTLPDPRADALADEIFPQIRRSVPFEEGALPYFRLIAEAREHTEDRARFWWRLATTPGVADWSAVHLPAPLFPLYRLVRLGRVARSLF